MITEALGENMKKKKENGILSGNFVLRNSESPKDKTGVCG